jgi:hypothetical protein
VVSQANDASVWATVIQSSRQPLFALSAGMGQQIYHNVGRYLV